MSSRFATNLPLLVLAGCLAVACFALSHEATGWIALGVGAAASVVSMLGFGLRRRGGGQRVLDVIVCATGGWALVSSRVFGPATVKWMSFAAAAALAALAALGLILHELMRPATAVPPAASDGHARTAGLPSPSTVAAAQRARLPAETGRG